MSEPARPLVLLDLRFDDGALVARAFTVEVADGVERLGVRWEHAPDEPGFVAIGDGVAHMPASVVTAITEADVALEPTGVQRWSWHRELPAESPWLMLMIVLPPGHTFTSATPGPVAAKLHRDRIAVTTMMQADADGRGELGFALAPTADAAAAVQILATAGSRLASTDSRTE
jgi:hypothetical protein